mmetsp:Transcript_24232/g.53805  ORF Transcript_24232/g.53805 Transcript_24232/m.53805 type:complete len:153 (-) Transcript_24232:70-528(-)
MAQSGCLFSLMYLSLVALLAVPCGATLLRGPGHAGGARLVIINATTCGAASKHLPKRPDTLAEYKDEALGCLTWCGALGDSCFRGCLDPCLKSLKDPPCAGFVVDNTPCFKACNALKPGMDCLGTVSPNSTHECHQILGATSLPEEECLLGR